MLGPKYSYLDIVDKAIDNMENNYKHSLPLRPSSSGHCERELAYKTMEFLGKADYEVPDNPPHIKRLFSLGHAIEKHCKRWVWEAKDWFTPKFTDTYLEIFKLDIKDVEGDLKDFDGWIVGEIDDIYWSETHKCIIDYKSKGDKWSTSHKTKWDQDWEKYCKHGEIVSDKCVWIEDLEDFLVKINDPYLESNFLQLNVYANASFIKNRGIDHAALIQYRKNDSMWRELRFKPCEKLFKQVQDKFQSALNAAGKGKPELANRTYELGSVKCAYCPYRKQCYPELSEKDVTKAYYNTLPPKKWPVDTSRAGTKGAHLEKLFKTLADVEPEVEKHDETKRQIVKYMYDNKLPKIKLDNGEVYVIKYLKSSKAYVLRKGKL